jgi:hypothetical protein
MRTLQLLDHNIGNEFWLTEDHKVVAIQNLDIAITLGPRHPVGWDQVVEPSDDQRRGDGVPRRGGRRVGPCRRARRSPRVFAKMGQDVAWHRRPGFFVEPPVVVEDEGAIVEHQDVRVFLLGCIRREQVWIRLGMPAMYTRCATDGSPAAASWITAHPYDQPTATTGAAALAIVPRTSAASAVNPADAVRCDGRSGTITSTSLSRRRSATHRQSAGLDHIP